MTYLQALEYLSKSYNYEKAPLKKRRSFDLGDMQRLAALFGDPERSTPSVHVAGTKGKGSTSAMISSMLREAGYSVGLYMSPHVMTPRERVRINNADITPEEFARHINEIRDTLKKKAPGFKPSYFEIMTLLAFLCFARRKTDINVFEVGMGGRYDATNVIYPLVTCITSISFDHTKELGTDLGSIAGEKAMIIKAGTVCVSAAQDKAAMTAISRRCAAVGARLYPVEKFADIREHRNGMGYEVFALDVMNKRYHGLRINLAGRHQIENAAVSVLAVNVLNKKGFNVNEEAVRKGLARTDLPSRFELVKAGGRTYCLDGAHNAESAACLSDTVKRNFKGSKSVTLIIGMSADKDIVGTCRELNHMASTVIVTRSGNPRAALPGDISKMFKGERVLIAGDAKDAVKIAGRISRAGDIILVTGSFYLTGEVKELLAHASKK